MVKQTNGEYKARDSIMTKYFDKLRTIMVAFEYFNIWHIPKQENARCTFQLSISTDNSLHWTCVKYVDIPSIDNVGEVQQINDKPSWIDPIINFLIEKMLPNDPLEVNG